MHKTCMLRIRAASIFLLICLLFPVVGMFCWLQVKKTAVRKQVKHQLIAEIDRAELVLLKFAENEKEKKLRWEHSKEFEFAGEMYDVVETEMHGDTTYYWCWWDHEETKLNRQLNQLALNALAKDPQHNRHKQRLTQFFQSLYFVEPKQQQALNDHVLRNQFVATSEACTALKPAPPTPPPQLG